MIKEDYLSQSLPASGGKLSPQRKHFDAINQPEAAKQRGQRILRSEWNEGLVSHRPNSRLILRIISSRRECLMYSVLF
jgi:hypothetical protein